MLRGKKGKYQCVSKKKSCKELVEDMCNADGARRVWERPCCVVIGLLLIFFGFGCAGEKPVKKDPFFEKWKIAAEESKGYSPPTKTHVMDLPAEGRVNSTK